MTRRSTAFRNIRSMQPKSTLRKWAAEGRIHKHFPLVPADPTEGHITALGSDHASLLTEGCYWTRPTREA
jgi:hypothetical protein